MLIALVGNQNSGKTTLFNALTGSDQHVGNFPGVTVEQVSGALKGNSEHTVVDLPGVYSLRPYSSEEIVTRDFIIKNKPDAIINIVDATNIQRSLYLTLQLLELRIPMVLALNMMDELRNNGGSIRIKKLSQGLGIPACPIAAAKGEGLDELVRVALELGQGKIKTTMVDLCPDSAAHRCIHSATHLIEDHARALSIPPRYCAIRLIEGDDRLAHQMQLNRNELDTLEHMVVEMEMQTGMDRHAALADLRYAFIGELAAECLSRFHLDESRERRMSRRIDTMLTGKYTALPIFFVAMLLIFWLTFDVIGGTLSDLLSAGVDQLTASTDAALIAYGMNPVARSLLVDGAIAGVGSVLSFLPLIIVLFFFLALLEDSGYMARVAFVMDKPLRRLGLSGRSFVPMLMGFGCSVPAIMAARTLPSQRDRRLTILLTPFMSCSAKIPIYAVFCAAFFPKHAAWVMISLYIGGMVVGIIVALLLNKVAFRGRPAPFVMELPNYRMPTARNVLLLLWGKALDFIRRAFTIIFLASMIIWFLQTFDIRLNVAADSADSLLAMLGRFIAPILKPLGCADWRVATALISGFTAKEAVISTLAVLLGSNLAGLEIALSSLFTPLAALSFLVFTLLYTPCAAAIATVRKELGRRMAWLMVLLQCSVAWIAGTIVFQLGALLIAGA